MESILRRVRLRRRVRRGFAWGSFAGAPASVVAAGAAVVWRLGGSGVAMAALIAAACAVAAAWLAGFARGEAALRSAEELDRRAGLDALLATGLELMSGPRRDALATAVMSRAEAAAGSLDPDLVPLGPPAWARYLTVPLALAFAALVLPAGGAAETPGLSVGALAVEARPGAEAGREPYAVETPGRADAEPAEARAVFDAYVAERRAAERTGGGPRARVVFVAERGIPAENAAAGEEAHASDTAETGGSGPGAEPHRQAGTVAPEGGALDQREAAVLTERFPEYEDILRRYFAGG